MKKFHYLDTIISPNVTEKSTQLSEFNKVVFKVHKGASKDSIKRSVEKLFKVKDVNSWYKVCDEIKARRNGQYPAYLSREILELYQKKFPITLS